MEELELHAYAERLASASPTPGGGSAAAVVGALGAALCAMVARITGPANGGGAIAEEADRLRRALLVERRLDEVAYGAVVTAMGLPKTTPDEKTLRTRSLQDALATAATAPMGVARRAAAVVALAEATLQLGNDNLVSDVLCAAEFGAAALAASAANVRINHKYLKDAALVNAQAGELAELEASAREHVARVRRSAAEVLTSASRR